MTTPGRVDPTACRLRWMTCMAGLLFMAAPAIAASPVGAAPSAGAVPPAVAHAPKLSLIGTPLRDPQWSPQVRAALEKDIAIARAVLAMAPEREDSYIWLGRRLAYMNRFDEAIAVFDQGLERFPDSYRLLRFRARKQARSRDFGAAIADYERGLALMRGVEDSYEPDGIPNARNQTLGSYRSNFHYYLAQTRWAVGDYAGVLDGMARSSAEPLVQNADHQIATRYWRYLALRKLGRHDDAAALVRDVPDDLVMIENGSYYDGVRLMKGSLASQDIAGRADAVSQFAVAMLAQFNGDEVAARRLMRALVVESPQGFWPAETELTRLSGNAAPTAVPVPHHDGVTP